MTYDIFQISGSPGGLRSSLVWKGGVARLPELAPSVKLSLCRFPHLFDIGFPAGSSFRLYLFLSAGDPGIET
eukprot:2808083-Amphidinium_carterae.1